MFHATREHAVKAVVTMESLGELWRALPANDLLRTGILLACLVAVRVLVARTLARQPQISIEMRRRWSVNLRNALLIAGLIGIVAIWSRELQTVALQLQVFVFPLPIPFSRLPRAWYPTLRGSS